MAIKTIESFNLQSHEGLLVVELPETGLVRFAGENNEGKSVIGKVLDAVLSGKINRKSNRKALRNRNHQFGELKLTKYNGDYLLAHIDLEASKTYVEVQIGGQVIRRHLLDRGIDDLCRQFGFHYDANRDFSLNMYQTYDPLLFITTSPVVNYDILQNAITDESVTKAVENIQGVRAQLKDTKEKSIQKIGNIQGALANLTFCDLDKEKAKLTRVSLLKHDITCLKKLPVIPDIKETPDFSDLLLLGIMDRIDSSLDNINVIEDSITTDLEILLGIKKIPNLIELIDSILENEQALEDNVCPMCNRSYAEDITHSH